MPSQRNLKSYQIQTHSVNDSHSQSPNDNNRFVFPTLSTIESKYKASKPARIRSQPTNPLGGSDHPFNTQTSAQSLPLVSTPKALTLSKFEADHKHSIPQHHTSTNLTKYFSPFPTGMSINDIGTNSSTTALLPYILDQQQQLLFSLSQEQSQNQFSSHKTVAHNNQLLTQQETRDILIAIHHTCQDIKESLSTLHSHVDEIWSEMSRLNARQSIVEHHTGINIVETKPEETENDDKRIKAEVSDEHEIQ
ncbi:hypothetical protein G9A89_003786 [Geosiphon pyriformis]|nr:hypothetical protein G9A89_003786 [Geosiphon pyriformis]